MSHLNYSNIFAFILGIFIMLFNFSVYAQDATTSTVTTTTKKVIITPVPKTVKCTNIPAHWEGDIWVDTQSVCTYENITKAWVSDYWTCTKSNVDTGECMAWEFKPGHWETQ